MGKGRDMCSLEKYVQYSYTCKKNNTQSSGNKNHENYLDCYESIEENKKVFWDA